MKKLAFIGQEYFHAMFEDDLNDLFEVKVFPFNFEMNLNDFKGLIEFQADFNVFFRGEFISNELLDLLNGIKINLSSEPFPRKINNKWHYTKDSLVRYFVFRKIRGKKFDYVFHYDKASLLLFEKDKLGISGEFLLPAATKAYAPENVPKKWDLFFFGRSSIHREKFFAYSKHKYNFLHIAHGIWGKDVVNYVSRAKINLNVHAEEEISWEPRVQAMLAMGAFVISEKINPNDYLRPGKDYVEVETPEDLNEKIEYYLKNEEEREKIAENGRKRALEYFSADRNFKDLIKKIENHELKNFKTEPRGSFLFDILNIFWLLKIKCKK